MFDRFIKTEERTLENPNAPVSADDFLHIMGWGDFSSAAGVTVNVDNALGVPAVWSAVNFISGTFASLPLEVHRRTDTGHKMVRDGVGAWLDRAVNPTPSSFAWRKYIFGQVLTGGRSVTLIVRNGAGVITDLVPLDTANLHFYETNENGFSGRGYRARTEVYLASEVIDLTFMLKHNQIDIRGPIMHHKDIIGMAIGATRYASKAFQSGRIPPAVLQGPFQSGAAAQRASEYVAQATAKLAKPVSKKIKIEPRSYFAPLLLFHFLENPMKVKLLVSMAGPDISHNAGNEIDVDDATAKRYIERNIAQPIASKPAKETAEKKVPRKREAVTEPRE